MVNGPLAITAKSVYIHGYSADTAEIPTAVLNAAGTAIMTAADAAETWASQYRAVFQQASCAYRCDPDAPLSVTWMGAATLLVDDGSSALMTMATFLPARPGHGWRRVSPSASGSTVAFARATAPADGRYPVHTHDHAMDSALVADRTGFSSW